MNKTQFDAFDEDFSAISNGQWFAVRKHARWIGSAVAFALPNKNKFNTLKIHITARPFLYKALVKQQRVLVKIKGQQVKEMTFNNKETKEISLDVSRYNTSKPLVVTFEMPDAIAPSSISDSQDARLLSLHITEFEVSTL